MKKRMLILLGWFACFFVFLFLRLGKIQIIDMRELSNLAVSQRQQTVAIEIPRGNIYDQKMVPLTNYLTRKSLVIFPSLISNDKEVAEKLSELTQISTDEIVRRIKEANQPFKLRENLDDFTAQAIMSLNMRGVLVADEKVRYGNGIASHLIGYIKAISNTGVSGIEAKFDQYLKGNNPESIAATVDAAQNLIPGLGFRKVKATGEQDPYNVVLTLDARIQLIVEQVMDQKLQRGAVVVMDARNGDVLAMASRPNFDQNYLNNVNDSQATLFNRAITSYPPGSVFKMVVAAAALEEGIVKPHDHFYCKGYIEVGDQKLACTRKQGHGELDFSQGFAYSCNPVFVEVGQKLGAKKLVEYARKFGFGKQTQVHLPEEMSGNIPDPDELYAGDLANASIGQGSIEVTPLQVATMLTAIVNDGKLIEPRVVKELKNADGLTVRTFPSAEPEQVISAQTAYRLREMMEEVTKYGSGVLANVERYGAAGKTGSAETGQIDKDGKWISHAWFAGFTPLQNPQYIIVVFVEGGMSGGDVAAPIFKEIALQILNS